MNKKNILFILPFFPYPLVTGGHQGIFNGIKILKEHANVFIFYEENWNENNKHLYSDFQKELGFPVQIYKYKEKKPDCYVKTKIKKTIKSLFNELKVPSKKIDADDPYIYIRDISWDKKTADKITIVNRIINEQHIDIIQCEMLDTIGYVFDIPSSVKKIFVHHEIGFVKEEYLVKCTCRNINNYTERLSISKKHEVDALNQYDVIVTLSSTDSLKLKQAGVLSDVHSSFCIINTISKCVETNCNPYEITFVGSGNHPPNNDGLKWFLDNCWEKLRNTDSRYKLSIVGIWDKKCINSVMSIPNHSLQFRKIAKKNNIDFKGYIQDLHGFLNKTITICPIRYGSGIRMKLIESAYACSPIVSTYMGAEGISFESYTGKNSITANCLLADTPEDFIKNIILLQDNGIQKNLTNNALSMVKETYTIDKLEKNRLPLYL